MPPSPSRATSQRRAAGPSSPSSATSSRGAAAHQSLAADANEPDPLVVDAPWAPPPAVAPPPLFDPARQGDGGAQAPDAPLRRSHPPRVPPEDPWLQPIPGHDGGEFDPWAQAASAAGLLTVHGGRDDHGLDARGVPLGADLGGAHRRARGGHAAHELRGHACRAPRAGAARRPQARGVRIAHRRCARPHAADRRRDRAAQGRMGQGLAALQTQLRMACASVGLSAASGGPGPQSRTKATWRRADGCTSTSLLSTRPTKPATKAGRTRLRPSGPWASPSPSADTRPASR